PPRPAPPPFPTRRSSDLGQIAERPGPSVAQDVVGRPSGIAWPGSTDRRAMLNRPRDIERVDLPGRRPDRPTPRPPGGARLRPNIDRKSTRLNSSHQIISY